MLSILFLDWFLGNQRKIRSTFRLWRKKKDWFAKFHFARASLCELPHCRADAFVPPQKCLDSGGKIPCRGATRRGNFLRFFLKYKLAEREGVEPSIRVFPY